ncbi:hypothetical protein [Jongsikchunia kroppenstedtii]|uniref:hypothetical protein n=1 Tax=Jongsikchunia kroppenstedtii TaxID=1121721 RepID=UPI00036332B3|nr:hypothetical protein [Jongsikchunia kroppenstedtii]
MAAPNTMRITADQAGLRAGVMLAGVSGAGGGLLRRALTADLADLRVPCGADGGAMSAVGLFLIDPVAVADAEDRRVLTELRSQAAAVALVCTKIDAFWDWPDTLYASRELLDPDHRLPVFAVTAAGALAGDRDASGLPDLVAWIREQLSADAVSLRALAADSVTQAAIDDARDAISEDDSAALARRRTQIAARRDRGRTDRLHAVRVAAGQRRAQLLAEVHTESRAFAEAAGHRTDRIRSRGDGFEEWFRHQLDQRAASVRRRLIDELDAWEAVATAGFGEAAQESPGADGPPRAMPCRPVPTSGVRREDLMMIVLGASAGLGLGRLAVAPMAAVDTLQWVSMPLSLLLGFVVAGVVVRERRLAALRGRLRSWAQDAVAEWRAVLEQEVVAAIGSAESALTGRIGRYYERRSRSTADQVAEVEGLLSDSRRRRADAEARLAELLAVRHAAEPIPGSPAS